MTWWSVVPALIVVVTVLFVPGVIFTFAAGARGTAMVTSAAAAGVGIIGFAGVAGGVLNIDWSITWLGLCAIVFATVAYLITRVIKAPSRPVRSAEFRLGGWPGTVAGAGLGALIIGLQVKTAIDRPDHIAQRYDDVFHLNAVRFILETDNASTLSLGRMLSPDRDVAIYPSAWHSVAALAAEVTGAGVPVSANALNIAIAALIWPLSCIFLAQTVVGKHNLALLATGVLSAVFPAFPLALFEYGTLFPNMLSYSVLPVALGLVISASRLAPPLDGWHRPGQTLTLAAVVCALATAQPNGMVALLAMFLPIGLWSWNRWAQPFTRSRNRAYWVRVGTLAVAGAAYFITWRLFLLGFDDRVPFTTGGAALGEALTGSVAATETNWILAAFIALGIGVLFLDKRKFWLLLVFLIPVILYVTAASLPRGPLRMALIGAWYQDAPRLAALLPVVTVLVAIVGISWLHKRVVRYIYESDRFPRSGVLALRTLTVLALIAVLYPVAFSGAMADAVANARRAYAFSESSDVLTPDERALIRQLPELVPEDTVIGVNPWNGGALAYAYTGIAVSQYHMDSRSDSLRAVTATLDQAQAGDPACRAADSIGIEYVLDFGNDYLLDFEGAFKYPAFDDVPEGSGFELVQSVGEASLYRIANCL